MFIAFLLLPIPGGAQAAKPNLNPHPKPSLFADAPGSQAVPPRSESDALADIRELVETTAAKDQFSGAVLIARGSQILWQGAYGWASSNEKIQNQTTTRFDIGSIVKSFTRVAIAQLFESGKLKLDDRIGRFLPDYPNALAREKVTVDELLEMRSGIGDFFGPRFQAMSRGDIRGLADYLPLFAAEPLAFEPGTKQAYSNGGYIVLGLIIEKVSGESYYDYVREHVFQPAGMRHTDFPFSDMPHDDEATGYTRVDEVKFAVPAGARRANYLMMPARGSSAGSARSTVNDLFLYSRALAANVLLQSGGTAAKLGISGAAMGVAGGAPGLNALLETGIHGLGAANYTLVIMSNYDPPSAEALGRQVRALLRSAR
jgi:D-alanyl-D-alanine carboxypeptidase